MAFVKEDTPVQFADLKSVLSQSRAIDPALYQTIQTLIERLDKFQVGHDSTVNNINNSVNTILQNIVVTPNITATYHTFLDESSQLPQSVQLLAGAGIVFDDSVLHKRTIKTTAAGMNLDYFGDYTPGTYYDGDIVIGSDGITYMCVKDGTTTPPEAWPGASGSPVAAHHLTHQIGGSDIVDVKLLGGYPGGTVNYLRADGTFATPPGGGTNLDYLGGYVSSVYHDGDIVVGSDGIAYMCIKEGTTTPPETWPGGGNVGGGGGTSGPHHATHETGGSDAIVSISAAIITSGVIADARLTTNVLKYTGGYPGGTVNFLRADGTFQPPPPGPQGPPGVAGPHHATHELGGTDIIQNVAWLNQPNIFTANQRSIATRPMWETQFPGNPVVSRIGQVVATNRIDISSNLGYNGADWISDDTSQPSLLYVQQAGEHDFYVAVAGANPRTAALSQVMSIKSTGTTIPAGLGSTPLNASNLTSGTIPSAVLGTGVALIAAANVFTAGQYIQATNPALQLTDTPQPADNKTWRIWNSNKWLIFDAISDSNAVIARSFYDRNGNLLIGGGYYELGHSSANGYWVDVAYNSANYSTNSSGSIYAGTAYSPYVYRYCLIGKTMLFQAALRVWVLNDTTNEIRFAIPTSYALKPYDYSATGGAAENQAGTPSHYVAFSTGVSALAMAFVNVSGRFVSIQRGDGALGVGYASGETYAVQFMVQIALA